MIDMVDVGFHIVGRNEEIGVIDVGILLPVIDVVNCSSFALSVEENQIELIEINYFIVVIGVADQFVLCVLVGVDCEYNKS